MAASLVDIQSSVVDKRARIHSNQGPIHHGINRTNRVTHNLPSNYYLYSWIIIILILWWKVSHYILPLVLT